MDSKTRRATRPEMSYWFDETPFGRAVVASTRHGVCHLSFVDGPDAEAVRRLTLDFPAMQPVMREDRRHREALSAFLRGDAGAGHVELDLTGTLFQTDVWLTLRKVPRNRTVTYSELARLAGYPGAARAVGTAMKRNPVALLIPCHRVVRADGLGGYNYGIARKRAILEWESGKGS